ncbi:MAG TPA: benzoate/H(+) symporter BenE family transporter [Humidesulfovibrio sp.]|uniref:benzoate/H(+) symporter BenE family transporter n=1 Tax=Humidesulfovibrio sp. TaxID=2910988 RepID=UPI002B5645A3|nr:benzoate/H(+) symporter BenE family transporter [Humidesulfovibrio sp.]HWR03957.1 benzoate/H(+) symporter BenE family transporter [Humidesulfovibrio sp.]
MRDSSPRTLVLSQAASLSDLRRDFSLSAAVAGIIAVMVSYGGPAAIIFQAAGQAGLTSGQLTSWIWAISIGSGLCGLILSLIYRAPVIIAWSTPGAALLAAGWAAYPYPEAIGAFVFAAVAITVCGATGLFGALMERIPQAVVAAMLAGILFRFGVEVFTAMRATPLLVAPMLACYVAMKRLWPRYAIVATLLTGLIAAAILGLLDFSLVEASIARPELTMPSFSLGALIGLGVPLFLVTMTGQNATGLGVLRTAGYQTPGGPLVAATGALSALLAPFGSHGINLAAITAAICTGPEAHGDPDRRYVAGVVCGLAYLVVGLFGATLVALFTALPTGLIASISGLALFGALISGLTQAMADEARREAALITFLLTVSGVSVYGVGSAFWGLVGGVLVNAALSARKGGAA